MKVWFVLFVACFLSSCCFADSIGFDDNWRFYRGDAAGAEAAGFDDSSWRKVDLPHDWSIEDLAIPEKLADDRVVSGPFDSFSEGADKVGYTVGGIGWYRKHFALKDNAETVYVLFDGIYMNADIWLNGHLLGNHLYGYTAFYFELSEFLNPAGEDNLIAVKVNNVGKNSRWYSGSGIYRHVELITENAVHIKPWGVFACTNSADAGSANISIQAELLNDADNNQNIELQVEVFNPDSKLAAIRKISTMLLSHTESKPKFDFVIDNPNLWSVETPELYKVVCTVSQEDKVLDCKETDFGVRVLDFDAQNGLFLNGKSLKLKGGAMHANNGPLGAAAYDRAEERRLEIMKSCGFNAVRCAHNPPSKVFLDACDRLGMLAIVEAFDAWNVGWLEDDYHINFEECWQQDVRSMIMRDRNHPSIFTWSIGNQIREGKDPAGVSTASMLADYVRMLDPSRPVTANVAMAVSGNWRDGSADLWRQYDPLFTMLDICGYSYQSVQYVNDHERLPDRILFSSEIDSRNCFRNWMRAIENNNVLGNFTWTAMDYMGEAASGWFTFSDRPKSVFPWSNSYCGDIDICGFRKPRSYYREILFNPDADQVYLFVKSPVSDFAGSGQSLWGWDNVAASWSWPDSEGKELSVEVYSGCEQVELFLNEKSMGVKDVSRETEYKACWQVPYETGMLRAAGYRQGILVVSQELVTAGKPYKVRLTADRQSISAGNKDLAYVTVEVLDENDILVPDADNLIEFKISDSGMLAAVANSNPVSLESFQKPCRKAWHGKCLAVIKSVGSKAGTIKVEASSDGLESGFIEISSKAGKE